MLNASTISKHTITIPQNTPSGLYICKFNTSYKEDKNGKLLKPNAYIEEKETSSRIHIIYADDFIIFAVPESLDSSKEFILTLSS
jgi:hypothetical protein